MDTARRVLLAKVGAWGLGLFPLARLAWWTREGVYGLGANPIERALHHSGWWALVLLLATLAVTPLRRVTGLNELARIRRPLGLFAFFWATVHLGIYLGLDQLLDWEFIVEDVVERPFITIGMAAWLILLPLAVTSTRGWIRRLGRRWGLLHRSVYLATILGIIHYYWRVRADTREPLLLAAAFVALMALRMRWTARPRRSGGDRAGGGSGEPGGGGGARSRTVGSGVSRGKGAGDASDGAEGAAGAPGAGGASGSRAGSG